MPPEEVIPDYPAFPEPLLPVYPEALVVWGNPYHGLVEGQVLTLSNGVTRSVTTATAQSSRPGDVIAWQQPVPQPLQPQSPEDAAADAAAGMEWRDYALIYGCAIRCVNGTPLASSDTWIYAAPDRSRWAISLAGGTIDLSIPWSATLTARRFGAFGTPPEIITRSMTLSDWQQAIPGKIGGDYSIAHLGDVITSVSFTLEDASLSGARAVFMIGRAYSADPIARRSLGFVEAVMTGTPGIDWEASLIVARSRAQTLGVATYSDDEAITTQYVTPTFVRTYLNDGNPPACDAQIIVEDFPSSNAGGGTYSAEVGTRTQTQTITDRLVALTYDGEALTETTLSASNTATHDAAAPAFTGEGSRVATLGNSGEQNPDGSCRVTSGYTESSNTMVWRYTQDTVSTSACSLTLARGSVSVTMTASESMSTSETIGFSWANSRPTVNSSLAAMTFSWLGAVSDHADALAGSGSRAMPIDSGQPYPMFDLYLSIMALGTAAGKYDDADDGFFADQQLGAIKTATMPFGGVPPLYRHAVQRYSNRLAELVVNSLDIHQVPTVWDFLGAVGGATAGAVITSPVNLRFGSVQPITGEVARARNVPVCWV